MSNKKGISIKETQLGSLEDTNKVLQVFINNKVDPKSERESISKITGLSISTVSRCIGRLIDINKLKEKLVDGKKKKIVKNRNIMTLQEYIRWAQMNTTRTKKRRATKKLKPIVAVKKRKYTKRKKEETGIVSVTQTMLTMQEIDERIDQAIQEKLIDMRIDTSVVEVLVRGESPEKVAKTTKLVFGSIISQGRG